MASSDSPSSHILYCIKARYLYTMTSWDKRNRCRRLCSK